MCKGGGDMTSDARTCSRLMWAVSSPTTPSKSIGHPSAVEDKESSAPARRGVAPSPAPAPAPTRGTGDREGDREREGDRPGDPLEPWGGGEGDPATVMGTECTARAVEPGLTPAPGAPSSSAGMDPREVRGSLGADWARVGDRRTRSSRMRRMICGGRGCPGGGGSGKG